MAAASLHNRTVKAFAGVLWIALTLSASAAEAQAEPRIARIGIFTFGVPYSGPLISAFRDGLKAEGYVEGKNIAFVYRSVEGQPERAAALAAELVSLQVDLIVTEGFPTALAAKRATTSIPIVMAVVADPVRLGLVASLRRPGGNITGLTVAGADRITKQLQLLKELAPAAAKVAILYNAGNPVSADYLEEARTAAPRLGLALELVAVRNPEDLDAAFEKLMHLRPDAFVTLGDGMLLGNHKRIAEFALRSRLPGVFPERQFAEAGALVAYGPNIAANFRRAAAIVAAVLKGAKPAELPIEQPTQYDVVINMKTAKAIGLRIPPAVLVRADHIIE